MLCALLVIPWFPAASFLITSCRINPAGLSTCRGVCASVCAPPPPRGCALGRGLAAVASPCSAGVASLADTDCIFCSNMDSMCSLSTAAPDCFPVLLSSCGDGGVGGADLCAGARCGRTSTSGPMNTTGVCRESCAVRSPCCLPNCALRSDMIVHASFMPSSASFRAWRSASNTCSEACVCMSTQAKHHLDLVIRAQIASTLASVYMSMRAWKGTSRLSWLDF